MNYGLLKWRLTQNNNNKKEKYLFQMQNICPIFLIYERILKYMNGL